MKQLALAAVLFALAASAPLARESVTLADPVAAHGGVTYLDLMKQVIPDLALKEGSAEGHLPEGIIHLEGEDMTGETPEMVAFDHLDVERVKSEGRETIWVLADLGDGGNLGTYSLLAVFDDSQTPKLLDAVEVDTDQMTGFVDAPFAMGAGTEAMMVGSEHFNSSQSYQSRILAFVREGKLEKIASFFVFGTRSCDEWTTEELTVTSDDTQSDLWTIDATIVRNKALAGQDCEDPLDSDWRHREFIAQYVWDSAQEQYVPARNDFEDLARLDEALF